MSSDLSSGFSTSFQDAGTFSSAAAFSLAVEDLPLETLVPFEAPSKTRATAPATPKMNASDPLPDDFPLLDLRGLGADLTLGAEDTELLGMLLFGLFLTDFALEDTDSLTTAAFGSDFFGCFNCFLAGRDGQRSGNG